MHHCPVSTHAPRSCTGFTLVELSLVLVIIGLLVGGILAGQSLVRASEIRSLITQFNQFSSAINAFHDKYGSYPGDMPNATDYWGIAGGTGGPIDATCKVTASTDMRTCNGDGNGQISLPNGTGVHENFRFWQHLSNAGFITGQYSGYGGSTSWGAIASNSPVAKITNVMWMPMYMADSSTQPDYGFLDGVYMNYLEVGKSTGSSDPFTPFLTPAEMSSIDIKLDDGKPGLGNVVMRYYSTCATASARTQVTADYRLDSSTAACLPIFRNLF